MAEKAYVKLGETHRSSENITPGELNEAVDLDKLSGRTCEQCGQPLPATYKPPADEDWTTGICGCCDDSDSCLTGLFCPCLLFGRNVATFNDDITAEKACIGHLICVEGGVTLATLTAAFHGMIRPDTVCLLTEGLLFSWWVCAIYTGMGRQVLQRKYHLKDSPCDPCMVHCLLHWCAICQEHREMKNHLSESLVTASTVTSPPEVQEMNDVEKQECEPEPEPELPPSTSTSQEANSGENNLQIQPV